MEFIGDWMIYDPQKVIKIGLVLEVEKRDLLDKIWLSVELEAAKKIYPFSKDDFFFEDTSIEAQRQVIFSFRYYTPLKNRELDVEDK